MSVASPAYVSQQDYPAKSLTFNEKAISSRSLSALTRSGAPKHSQSACRCTFSRSHNALCDRRDVSVQPYAFRTEPGRWKEALVTRGSREFAIIDASNASRAFCRFTTRFFRFKRQYHLLGFGVNRQRAACMRLLSRRWRRSPVYGHPKSPTHTNALIDARTPYLPSRSG